MGPFARFVTRPNGNDGSDLIIGSFLKNKGNQLEPNTIYELSEWLGEITVRKVGESLVAPVYVRDSCIGVTWCQSFEDVAVQAGQWLLVSKTEYDRILETRRINGNQDNL